MTEIHETELPGIGVRQEFDTAGGARLGVLTTRTGRRELLLYDEDDPDSCRAVVHLDPADATVLSDLLGATRVSETAASLQRLEGLAIDWLTVGAASSLAGRTIGEARIRKDTGANVVAIVRGSRTNASPGPDDRMDVGDVLVSVGTPESVDALLALLQPS
ncbi:MAG: cation:proton antiporter regulatory subunit [Microthrixaceae bacterium]